MTPLDAALYGFTDDDAPLPCSARSFDDVGRHRCVLQARHDGPHQWVLQERLGPDGTAGFGA